MSSTYDLVAAEAKWAYGKILDLLAFANGRISTGVDFEELEKTIATALLLAIPTQGRDPWKILNIAVRAIIDDADKVFLDPLLKVTGVAILKAAYHATE